MTSEKILIACEESGNVRQDKRVDGTMNEPLTKDKIIEKLAELEHRQWKKWSKTLAEDLILIRNRISNPHTNPSLTVDMVNTLLKRWRANWKNYSQLDEATKEFDREWARKTYAMFEKEKVSAVRLLREKMCVNFKRKGLLCKQAYCLSCKDVMDAFGGVEKK